MDGFFEGAVLGGLLVYELDKNKKKSNNHNHKTTKRKRSSKSHKRT